MARTAPARLSARLQLEAGQRVLDAGCGLGGGAFLLAQRYDVFVDGIDLSHNMIERAAARAAELGVTDKVSLFHGDVTELDRPGHYDAIYSRDVFLHIDDKVKLLGNLHRLLRPRGRALFTDYCCGPRPWSDEFSRYVEQRGYSLLQPSDYAELIAEAGFHNVESADLSAEFLTILTTEIDRLKSADIAVDARQKLVADWQVKASRVEQGHQRWGLFEATK